MAVATAMVCLLAAASTTPGLAAPLAPDPHPDPHRDAPVVAAPSSPVAATVETVAGGVAPHDAADAVFMMPKALVADATHLFVADSFDHVVRRISLASGASDVIAGDGANAVDGDGGAATDASLGEMTDVAVDPAGSVFVAGGGRVRRIATNGTITTVIGGGTVAPVAGAPALGTTLGTAAVVAIGVDDLLVLEPAHWIPPGGPTVPGRVWRVGPGGTLTHIAGSDQATVRGDGGPAVDALLVAPSDLAVDPSGRILVSDWQDRRVRRIATDGTISTMAGGGAASPGDGGPATDATLGYPERLTVGPDGVVAIGEYRTVGDHVVRSVDLAGTITTIAGGGTGDPTSGGPATDAYLGENDGLATLGAGDLAIGGRSAVLRKDPGGTLAKLAGKTDPFPVDGRPALDVQLGTSGDQRDLTTLTTNPAGVLYGGGYFIEGGTFHDDRAAGPLIGFDSARNRYEHDLQGGVSVRAPDRTEIRTFPLQSQYTVGAVAVSAIGDVYQAYGEPRCYPRFGCSGAVQVTRFENPAVTTRPPLPSIGGNYQISGLAIDGAGGVASATGYCALTDVSEPCPHAVSHVNADGSQAGAGGAPSGPTSFVTRTMGVDAGGAVYYGADHQVWKIPLGGVPEAVAGTGAAGFSGDGGPALSATFGTIRAVTVAPDGSLYVADGPRIRHITTTASPALPRALALTGSAGAVHATWQPPLLDGGSPITGYQLTATVDDGSPTDTVTVVPATPPSYDITAVPRGAKVTVKVRTLTAGHESIDAQASITDGSGFRAMSPLRILDSRLATGGWNGPLSSATPRTLTVAGQGQVPATASAVVMNVTATGASAGSFLTVWPSDEARPNVSNLNFAAGETIPNLVTVKVSAAGAVSFANAVGTVDVVADIVGYYDGGQPAPLGIGPSDRYTSVTPTRLLDSRTPTGDWNGKLAVFVPRKLAVRGVGPVPATATAVVANVTATNATKGSFLTIWPTGYAKPTASSLNFAAGQTIPNLVVALIGGDGTITFANATGAVDVIVDVVGYFDPNGTSRFYPITPNRVLDSRLGVGLSGPFEAGISRALGVEGTPGIPADIDAVVANVTATEGTLGSFVSVYPDGQPGPSSSLNFAAGQTIPNLTVTGVSAQGKIAFTNAVGSVHLIADAVGYYAAPAPGP